LKCRFEVGFKVGHKVGLKVVSLVFWARGFLCLSMDGQPQATVVLCPCSLSQGFKEATMKITLFASSHIRFVAPRCKA
jgi:hypothetical protein